jgi:hypothetical protein
MSIRISLFGCSAAVALAMYAAPVRAQQPVNIAPNAPRDRPVSATAQCQWRAAVRAMAPLVAQARQTYPDAKRRFLAGLPPKSTFFVTTRLRDDRGREEQVFVAVDSAVGNTIAGRIWSPIGVVSGYRLRQPYTMPDSELVDWMFSRPDGSEEGNVVGKFLDTYTPPPVCSDSVGL